MSKIAPITLSAVQTDDFEQLVEIRIAAMRESLERIGRFDPERARERFRQGFSPEHTRFIEINGRKVGFVVVKPVLNQLLLDHLYVVPKAQRKKVGSQVLAHIFIEADSQGLPIRVGALKDSDSNRFYQRHGFRRIEQDEFDNYYIRHTVRNIDS
ncbi:GNAT family N-acetyltransferase [Aquirhabdus parva]|uniref:N-acetyltransferase n=1 Tax=Aquirhabdus parva TaxID=2283318 RepID=A0A345P851_9GAMM|nr:GNAT family N-acetyltransferase [Aquirhabdus parva]AXI03460.1 N-acetyltransferase [Aquirhabdus parva]